MKIGLKATLNIIIKNINFYFSRFQVQFLISFLWLSLLPSFNNWVDGHLANGGNFVLFHGGKCLMSTFRLKCLPWNKAGQKLWAAKKEAKRSIILKKTWMIYICLWLKGLLFILLTIVRETLYWNVLLFYTFYWSEKALLGHRTRAIEMVFYVQ